MKSNRALLAAVLTLCALTCFAQPSANEDAVWKLEHSYWEFVKAQDVAGYKSLWHENFVGWPSFSPQPVRKEHVADWMTSYQAKGLRLKSYSLNPAASQATGHLVVVFYRIATVWTGPNGSETSETVRAMHTWLRGDNGWQIISGMSMRETAPKQ
ncbi:MAG TPA: nuclear transport factor 2 family protein [Candidatus Sulfotelmatobacter sp.]|nr:nuclear transport factor 2 family protein [Candidatus Sulfotelmatobacter sp.]